MTSLQQAHRTINTAFEIFAHHRRRYVLRELHRHENPMELADLADEIAVRENEAPPVDVPTDEMNRLYLSLSQMHIPKLADAGFVYYEQERDEVTLTERAEHVDQYREFLTVD